MVAVDKDCTGQVEEDAAVQAVAVADRKAIAGHTGTVRKAFAELLSIEQQEGEHTTAAGRT